MRLNMLHVKALFIIVFNVCQTCYVLARLHAKLAHCHAVCHPCKACACARRTRFNIEAK